MVNLKDAMVVLYLLGMLGKALFVLVTLGIIWAIVVIFAFIAVLVLYGIPEELRYRKAQKSRMAQ